MPAIVDELVHGLAAEDVEHALLDADEVQQHNSEYCAEQHPRLKFAPRDCHRFNDRSGYGRRRA
jgi:hypothetical protein